MSTEPTQEQRAQAEAELNRTDLIDIRALRRNEAFGRYWMRRLRQKKDEADRSLKHDPLAHEAREIVRQRYLAYLDLEQIMDQDEPMLIRKVDAATAG